MSSETNDVTPAYNSQKRWLIKCHRLKTIWGLGVFFSLLKVKSLTCCGFPPWWIWYAGELNHKTLRQPFEGISAFSVKPTMWCVLMAGTAVCFVIGAVSSSTLWCWKCQISDATSALQLISWPRYLFPLVAFPSLHTGKENLFGGNSSVQLRLVAAGWDHTTSTIWKKTDFLTGLSVDVPRAADTTDHIS